jgi:hypothetical protein
MNQRIMDLADKAIEDMPKIRWEIPDEFCKKFALLIVQECADIADKYVREGDIDIAVIIKRHFGVEE